MNLLQITRWAVMTLALAAAGFGTAQAQSSEQDVAIWNDHLHVHQVYVFDSQGEQHLLGFVGHDELEYFDVPDDVEAMGPYRIAVRQHLPLPQLGVPAIEHPLKMSPVLSPLAGQMVSIIVGDEAFLSTVEVY
jgi:hypothetical protein